MSFEVALQTAIIAKLKASASLTSQNMPIYDEVPQAADSGAAANFPYIVVGDDSLINWDTDTEFGASGTVTIHSWSRYAGRLEVKRMQGDIYDALHDIDLGMTGYESVVCSWQQSDSFLDADGKTRHGVQTFNVLIEKI